MLLRYFLAMVLGVGAFLLTGCETVKNSSQAPVFEGFGGGIRGNAVKKRMGDYQVKRGDTLYSIAWANDLDYRILAEINALQAPYKIYAGQYLKTKTGFFHSLSLMFKKGKSPAQAQTQLARKGSSQPNRSNQKLAAASTPKWFSRGESKRKSEEKEVRYEIIKPGHAVPIYPKQSTPVKGWRWPANGRVVQGFSDRPGGNKGVNLAASYGAPVLAAASGKVVYRGSGLKGYGQLLLIKHNNSFLSAYAHNSRLLVQEGQPVVAGQKIAEMGRANHGMVQLHFEIRKNGQPVDPMIYLNAGRRS